MIHVNTNSLLHILKIPNVYYKVLGLFIIENKDHL